MAKKHEIRLGQLLVERQWCTLSQVNAGLVRQERLRLRNENAPLGRLLVDMGMIQEETLREALATLGALRLKCNACQTAVVPEKYERGAALVCERCQQPLSLADPEPPPPAGRAEPAKEKSNAMAPPVNASLDAAPAPSAGATPAGDGAKAPDPFVGKVLGGCQILERIAQGGMGVVYKARQLNLGRTVAVKVLASDLARDETFVRRFLQEARSAAQLSHGNIVHINDVGEYQGIFYFVMEYIDGQNLREILRNEQKLGAGRSIEIVLQILQALRHAHSRGIIHRDIKPENIMVTREGSVKLADLGLAKRMANENASGITHAGSILGTPFYMAPEQAKDFSKVDHRSDIYSLGVTLYKMLTGKVPFDGRSPIEVVIKALDGKKTPVRTHEPDVPADIEQIVDKMMHRLPEKRYQDAAEVIDALQRASVSLRAAVVSH